MNLKASLIYPQIVHIKFDNPYFLASSFIRIQEFYESPFNNIRGKGFNLEEYMDTYAREYGKFDYFDKWSAFNFPDIILKKFLNTQWYFTEKETKIFFNYISILVNWKKKFYVIGTSKTNDIDHELAHAFYYMSGDYKKRINNLISIIPRKISDDIKNNFKELGYADNVLNDELQAYLSTEKKFISVPSEILKEFKKTFKFQKLNFTSN